MYAYKALLTSRENRKAALEALCERLTQSEKDGWYPHHIAQDYTPAFEGGQRQQYIWEVILRRKVEESD